MKKFLTAILVLGLLCLPVFADLIKKSTTGGGGGGWSCTDADLICINFDSCNAGGTTNCDSGQDFDTITDHTTGWGTWSFANANGYNSTQCLDQDRTTTSVNPNFEVVETGNLSSEPNISCTFRYKIVSEGLDNGESAETFLGIGAGYTFGFFVGIVQNSDVLYAYMRDGDGGEVLTHGAALSLDTWYTYKVRYQSGSYIELNVDNNTAVSSNTGVNTQTITMLGPYLYHGQLSASLIHIRYDDMKCDGSTTLPSL